MADQQGSSSGSPVEELQMDDLAGPEGRTPETGPGLDGARATLKPTARRSTPTIEAEHSYHMVSATSSGEVQFRVPSRPSGRDTRELFDIEEPREREVLIDIEQPRIQAHQSNPREVSTVGRGRGLLTPDYQLRGEPSREREHYVPEREGRSAFWGQRDQRGLSPVTRSGIRQCEGDMLPRYIERGSREMSRVDHFRPSRLEEERVPRYDTRGALPPQQVGGRADPIEPRKYRKPVNYDGTGNWADYLVHFEIVAEINRWGLYRESVRTCHLSAGCSTRGIE
jgi:hypothetical protein